MFLNAVRIRNLGLLRFAVELHQARVIPPNTFVIDRGAVHRNAVRLASKARELGLHLYFMAKQIQYDPYLIEVIQQVIPGSVAVDWMGAEALIEQHVAVQHVGHLVPIPVGAIATLMVQGQPEVWTLCDLEAAEAVSAAASTLQRTQDVLLRVAGSQLFPGQEGGFAAEGVLPAAQRLARLPGLRVAGLTSYPCFSWDEAHARYVPTENMEAVLQAADQLRVAGFAITHINMPGSTSLSTLPMLAHYGATHGEPGHALTGTTPEQSLGLCEEEPAVLYVSEVSTVSPSGQALAYGGGLYARAHAKSALVGANMEELLEREAIPVAFPPAQFIDYQCTLDVPTQRHVHTGDTVIMAFRFQLFVQRSYRAIVEQNEAGNWELIAITPRPYFYQKT
ncbi:MAG TPA: alanine racemase [Ktedonobacteraceae bacterium]|nr:alanine racemase [Ktedonobacteraceae bacterium]